MTDLPRKPGTLSVAQPERDPRPGPEPSPSPRPAPNPRPEPSPDPRPAPDNSTFGEQQAEAMVPVKVLRGYWPAGTPGDVELDPKRRKLKADALCTLPEGEAQAAADNGIVRILTAKGYRDAQEAAAIAPPPPAPRTTIIHKTA